MGQVLDMQKRQVGDFLLSQQSAASGPVDFSAKPSAVSAPVFADTKPPAVT